MRSVEDGNDKTKNLLVKCSNLSSICYIFLVKMNDAPYATTDRRPKYESEFYSASSISTIDATFISKNSGSDHEKVKNILV